MRDRIYRFAEFELIAAAAELRTTNSTVRLQEKPLLLLCALLDHAPSLVTRDQLRDRMWGSDTFVDYEQGINVAVKKLRDALGDSADHPKFIQTVARKGHRFLVPVEIEEAPAAADSPDRNKAMKAAGPAGPIVPSANKERRPTPGFSWRWALTFVGVTVLSAIGLWFFAMRRSYARATRIESIAVLPLQDLSPDPKQEYFADSMTEELITSLAQKLPLRVISRTSAMRFKGSSQPIPQIAQQLGVQAVIEGSVMRSRSRVHVTVQLIDAAQDRHLWANEYDRELGDLLGVSTLLSQEIAHQVSATLRPRQAFSVTKQHAVDPEVYDLCLMGRYYWNKRTVMGLNKAVEYYQRAIDRDPTYAPAYAGLANAYAILPSYAPVNVRDHFEKAAAAAHRALELDETIAEAHANLAFVSLTTMSLNWSQMESEFQRAIELNPNYATAHHWYAFYLTFTDRPAEALAEIEQARRLDPLSAVINADEGHVLYGGHRHEEAIIRLRQAIELAPDLGQPHGTLALIHVAQGRSSEALSEAEIGLTLDPRNPRMLGEAGYVFATSGRTEEARKLLSRLQNLSQSDLGYPIFASFIQIGLGQTGNAIGSLEKTIDRQTGNGPYGLSQWLIFEKLNNDPRYQNLSANLREMRLARTAPRASVQ